MIRNKFTDMKSIALYEPNPVSMTIPDESLTIKEIFDRYQVNSAELMAIVRMRQQKQLNGGKDLTFDDLEASLDANQVYELRKRLAAKYKAPDLLNGVQNTSPSNTESTIQVGNVTTSTE